MPTPRLFILVGIPGCGKSTWANDFFDQVVSSDEIREKLTGDATDQSKNAKVFEEFHFSIEVALGHGEDIVADSTALDAFARLALVEIAKEYEAEVHLIVFTNVGQAIIRNESRDRTVPKDVMDRMLVKYERAKNDIEEEILAQYYKSVIEIRSLN